MKTKAIYMRLLLVLCLYMGMASLVAAQDSIWIRYDNRFLENKALLKISDYDSIEFRSTGVNPVLRRYSTQFERGYSDLRMGYMITSPGVLMFDNPGLIVYRPTEFSSMDFMSEDSQWSFARSKESEHFIVFWESGFGSNPNASTVPSNLRVDIDDLLKKAEQFYATNIDNLKMVVTGEGKSQLDRYKMEIYLLYQTEWLATGSGYDNKVGALWVNPSTCQPVGSTIAHEIGHSFQYQTYCDNILQGKPNNLKSGFRYGYPDSNGGNGFWEQCAQWQSYQDYPSEAINNYHFAVWIANHHRHFENEWQRYASYWLQYYMTERHGITALGRIWNESTYPEDAIQAYTRIFCDNDYEVVKKDLFEYAQKCATFDFDQIRKYVTTQYDNYTTRFVAADDGWWQVAYENCPAPTGFNVIPLDVPAAGTVVTVNLQGVQSGSSLLPDDPGKMVDGDGNSAGTATEYNTTAVAGNEGWAYGFVALKDDNTRVYGEANFTTDSGEAQFTVPAGTKRLFLIVQGAPTVYRQSPWDEDETTDDQLPYRVKVEGTNLQGYIVIDPNAEPKSIDLEYSVSCSKSVTGFNQGSINLSVDGSLAKIAEAFVMQPSVISSNISTIASNVVGSPSEGKIVLGLEDASGNISYKYTATSGFYCNAAGGVGTYAAGSPIWFEFDKSTFTLSYGHYPGKTTAGKCYTVRPVLVYTKNGVQYKVRIILKMYYDMAIPEVSGTACVKTGHDNPVDWTGQLVNNYPAKA